MSSAHQSKGTKPKRPSRRRRRSVAYGTHSRADAHRARTAAIAKHRRRFENLGRAATPRRDPKLSGPAPIRTRLIREAVDIVDRDPDLVAWVTDLLAARHKRPGRPRELSVRTALICFVVHTRIYEHFHLSRLPESLATMSWRTRRNLGIDYLRNGTPTQVTYDQLLDIFHAMGDAFDAWDETLDRHGAAQAQAIRDQRAADLQTFTDRLIAASVARAPRWNGRAALDATLKWSHERPPGTTLNSKIGRRGHDGDAGPAVSLTDVVGTDTPDPSAFEPVDPTTVTKKSRTRRKKRKSNWAKTWGLGSSWVGRPNLAKAVHGYALHTIVRADTDDPCVVEGFTVTPANGDPADAVLPVLRRIHDRRVIDPAVVAAVAAGDGHVLGDVVADPAYTMVGTARWQLPLKALGAIPVGRLHRTNQDGPRRHKVGRGTRAGHVITYGGRPVCECLLRTDLADLRYPKFPYTTAEIAAYQLAIDGVARFEWKPNGAPRSDGKRSWLAPHGGAGPDGHAGGCEHCCTAEGPIVEDGRPVARCCTVRSRLIPAEVTALDIDVRHGSTEWYARWNRRNRVEGSYGVLKNLSVINWGRDYHHFVGLARETLVATFAIVAYNAHMIATWEARKALEERRAAKDPFGPLPSAQPTETVPAATQTRAETRRKPKRGPKGLDFLGPPG